MADKKNIVIKVKYPTSGRQTEEVLSAPQTVTEWNVKRIALALIIIILMFALALYFYFKRSHRQDFQHHLAMVETSVNKKKYAEDEGESKQDVHAIATTNDSPHKDAIDQQTISVTERKTNIPDLTKRNEPLVIEKSEITANVIGNKQHVASKLKDSINVGRSNKIVKSELSYKVINKKPVDIINSTVSVSGTKGVRVNYFTEVKGLKNKTIYHEWIKQGRVVNRYRLKVSADRWRTTSRKLFNYKSVGHWHVRTVNERGQLIDQKEFDVVTDR